MKKIGILAETLQLLLEEFSKPEQSFHIAPKQKAPLTEQTRQPSQYHYKPPKLRVVPK
jgi:hypothetical protein